MHASSTRYTITDPGKPRDTGCVPGGRPVFDFVGDRTLASPACPTPIREPPSGLVWVMRGAHRRREAQYEAVE